MNETNLIKLDEYAKSLGFTIYDITFGYTAEDGEEIKQGIYGFNVPPQQLAPDFKGFVQCLKQKYMDNIKEQ